MNIFNKLLYGSFIINIIIDIYIYIYFTIVLDSLDITSILSYNSSIYMYILIG